MKQIGVIPNMNYYKIIFIVIVVLLMYELKQFLSDTERISKFLFAIFFLGIYVYFIFKVNHIRYDNENIILISVFKDKVFQKNRLEYFRPFLPFLDFYKIKFEGEEEFHFVVLDNRIFYFGS